jgi:hypothetical protein
MLTRLNQLRKRVNWLLFFFVLTVFASANLIVRSEILKPPIEFEAINFRPIIWYDQLSFISVLLLPVCLLIIATIFLVRKQFGRMLLTILFTSAVIFFGAVSLILDDSFGIIDSLKQGNETFYLGTVGDIEGWGYVAFCVEKESQATCDYFYTVTAWDKQPTLNHDKSSGNVLVIYETQTLYTYNGRLPGICSSNINVPGLYGDCGANFEATR